MSKWLLWSSEVHCLEVVSFLDEKKLPVERIKVPGQGQFILKININKLNIFVSNDEIHSEIKPSVARLIDFAKSTFSA